MKLNYFTLLDWLYFYNYPKEVIQFIESLEVKPKIVYSKNICRLFLCANGVTLYPNIYIYSPFHIRKELINHELIHWFQQKNTKHFYLAYAIETLCNGYKNNKYEKEAYRNEDNLSYILCYGKESNKK
jgi:hypothetical protein